MSPRLITFIQDKGEWRKTFENNNNMNEKHEFSNIWYVNIGTAEL